MSSVPTFVPTISSASTKFLRKVDQKSGSGPRLFTTSPFESCLVDSIYEFQSSPTPKDECDAGPP